MRWTWKTSGIIQGIYMGLGFCTYTTLMWYTKLDTTYLNIGQYLDIAIILLPVVMILWAIQKAHQEGRIRWWERVLVALIVGAVSFLIYDPFLYLYHHHLNPNWFRYVLELKEFELQTAHTDPAIIRKTLHEMTLTNAAQSGMFRPSALIPSVVIIPTLIALVSLLVIRRR